MQIAQAERRRCVRVAAAYPAVVRDRRGHVLARGRTANISEGGVFVIVAGRDFSRRPEVVVELSLPSASERRHRLVCYSCRVAHAHKIGQLLGAGLEFIEKLQ